MGSNSEQGKATARQVQEGGRNEQQSRPPRLGTGREEGKGMRRARAGARGREENSAASKGKEKRELQRWDRFVNI